MTKYSALLTQIRSLLGVLELPKESRLILDSVSICNYLENSLYRIAVFAPFNHGKSTLLNALLGNKTLPIDLVPTTGAAIVVGYAEELKTTITFKDDTTKSFEGIEILQQYAILDEDRRMKDEVSQIKVSCNHSWLKTGIEFLDLPGTNDRQAQNDLVRDKLLSADLIIHVLDARKLMTLEEREHLKQWLRNRGIATVIFVVNFLNLLTPEEKQEVKNRLYFVAESFRSDLPTGVSNIYCVDALPALRARLKGNQAEAQTTGITSLESALQTIVNLHRQDRVKIPRVLKICEQLLTEARVKQQQLQDEISIQSQSAQKQVAIKKRAEKLIQQSFNRSVSDFRGWLYFPNLLTNYHASCAIALQQTRFDCWLRSELETNVLNYQQAVNKWVLQGSEFFQHHNSVLLTIEFPSPPTIEISEYIPTATDRNSSIKSYIPQQLNFLLQKKAGAVILGGASYVISKIAFQAPSAENQIENKSRGISSQVYADAAKDYLQQFSDRANKILNEYEKIASGYITYNPPANYLDPSVTYYQLELLNNLIENLQQELNQLNYHKTN